MCVCISFYQLLDSAAIVFTRAFYLSLAVGDTVQRAFDIGKQAVKSSSVPDSNNEGNKYVLLPEGKSHASPIFKAPPLRSRRAPSQIPEVLRNSIVIAKHLPPPPEDFEGREVGNILLRRL